MSIKIEKIIGWLVFFTGLMTIFYSLYSSFNIFTGRMLAPEIFSISEKKETLLPQQKTGGLQDIQAQMQEVMGEQLKEFLPIDLIPKMLNLVVWSMLAGILIFGGTQISGLGIKLIKR